MNLELSVVKEGIGVKKGWSAAELPALLFSFILVGGANGGLIVKGLTFNDN